MHRFCCTEILVQQKILIWSVQIFLGFLRGRVVHQRGETSNRLVQFLEVLQGMGKLLKSPEAKNGRYFQWEALAAAA